MSIVPRHGERALVIGQTGSGKTLFSRFLLTKMPGTIIYDTKIEPKFKALTKVVVTNVDDAIKAIRQDEKNELDYVIVQPPITVTHEPKLLDELLLEHYERCRNITAYIDEVLQFHVNGKAGPGLLSLLTRGRSRGITTIMSTQRPAWLSRFCLTESQRFYVFRLVDKRDNKIVSEVIPEMDRLPPPPKYHFYYYDTDMDEPLLFKPVKVNDKETYTDEAEPRRKWF